MNADEASRWRRAQWLRASANPDPHDDLDYRMVDLEVIGLGDLDTVVVLSDEADLLRDDAFVVTTVEQLCDLDDWR